MAIKIPLDELLVVFLFNLILKITIHSNRYKYCLPSYSTNWLS